MSVGLAPGIPFVVDNRIRLLQHCLLTRVLLLAIQPLSAGLLITIADE
jgi:hypothetical protein